jgi:hypothetical protein
MVLDDERVQVLLDVGRVGARGLVGDTLVAPEPVPPHQVLEAVLGARGVVAQHVRGGRQPGQRRVLAQYVVGVDGEQEVGPAPGVLDVPRPVVPEVDPGVLVELARDAVQRLADQVLHTVRRAGVGDDPGADQGAHGGEAALDHAGLVLDDHAEADGLRLHGLTGPGDVGTLPERPRDVPPHIAHRTAEVVA